MNQASAVKPGIESAFYFLPTKLKKTFARRIVELFAGYDPDLTEQDRAESIPSVIKLLLVFVVCVLIAVGLLLLYLFV
jgi:hypothetical protein